MDDRKVTHFPTISEGGAEQKSAAGLAPQKMSPFLRNVQAVAAILVHAAGDDFVSYTTLVANVEAEVRGKTFGENELSQGDNLEGVVMSLTSCLIYAGILECNTFNKQLREIVYRADTAVRLSEVIFDALHTDVSRP